MPLLDCLKTYPFSYIPHISDSLCTVVLSHAQQTCMALGLRHEPAIPDQA